MGEENDKEFAKEILRKQMKLLSDISYIASKNDYVGLAMISGEMREIALTLVRMENSK